MTQRTRPSHAVCGEVRKEGGSAEERHKVSSKAEGLETLGALRREDGSPGFTAQCPGSGPLPAQTGKVLGLASPAPGPQCTPQFPGPHPCPCSADPPSYPRAAEGRSVLTNLALAQEPPWTSDGPARCLLHTFGSHLPPSPSHTTASTVSRCPGPCPEPREKTESRNFWERHAPCPRQGLGWHHAGITEFEPQITH